MNRLCSSQKFWHVLKMAVTKNVFLQKRLQLKYVTVGLFTCYLTMLCQLQGLYNVDQVIYNEVGNADFSNIT